MTGVEFVKLCFEEKEATLAEYVQEDSQSVAAAKLKALLGKGIEKAELFDLLDLVLTENYYRFLLALDGEASLGNVQNMYQLYDEEGNLLNPCGEIEDAAYRYFMEKD